LQVRPHGVQASRRPHPPPTVSALADGGSRGARGRTVGQQPRVYDRACTQPLRRGAPRERERECFGIMRVRVRRAHARRTVPCKQIVRAFNTPSRLRRSTQGTRVRPTTLWSCVHVRVPWSREGGAYRETLLQTLNGCRVQYSVSLETEYTRDESASHNTVELCACARAME
jgi:hypothetical protein